MARPGEFIPIIGAEATLTFPDGSTEAFNIEAPNSSGEDIYILGFRRVDILPDYASADFTIQRGYRIYQAIVEMSYQSHDMNLFRLLAAENISLKIPPPFSNDPGDYQTLDVMLADRRAVRNYLNGLAMAAPSQQSSEAANVVPAGALNLVFNGKKAFTEEEMLAFDIGLGFYLPITPETEINIFFDSSGSMDSTLAPLQTMRDTLLKDELIGFYNDDETLYNQKVNVIEFPGENTFDQLRAGDPTQNPVRNIVFQDESDGVYYTGGTIEPRSVAYETDITNLRSDLEIWPNNQYRGIIFQVVGGAASVLYTDMLQKIEDGQSPYSGEYGLKDYIEFDFNYNITDGSTPEYYLNLILDAL